MSKDLNIYQKIAVLQDKIKVKKANRNDFANFSYRTIQDILSELKPHLQELKLMIFFSGGKILENDKYILQIAVIDTDNPDDKIKESGEILIDRTKQKMDLSQKVLSAKTFLKKSLLEDLLLISEDDDPDSHNNTDDKKNTNNKKSNLSKEETEQLNFVKKTIWEKSGKDQAKSLKMLEELTSFKKDDKQIQGVSDFTKLRGKRLEILYNKLKKEG